MRKILQTDGQTNRQTDDGRLAIALAHSWNELNMTVRGHLRSSIVNSGSSNDVDFGTNRKRVYTTFY